MSKLSGSALFFLPHRRFFVPIIRPLGLPEAKRTSRIDSTIRFEMADRKSSA
jgi:hypothetical protein